MDTIYLSLKASGSLPPAPQMTVSSIVARLRFSLVCVGSLTETKLNVKALHCSGGSCTQKDGYDSSEWWFCPVMKCLIYVLQSQAWILLQEMVRFIVDTAIASSLTPLPSVSSTHSTLERWDSYHCHCASHSLTGLPLLEGFPCQRHKPTYSGSSMSPSQVGSSFSIADCE